MVKIPWFDRLVMSIAFFALCFLAGLGVMKYLRAPYPLDYALAGLSVTFLVYSLLSPLVRSK